MVRTPPQRSRPVTRHRPEQDVDGCLGETHGRDHAGTWCQERQVRWLAGGLALERQDINVSRRRKDESSQPRDPVKEPPRPEPPEKEPPPHEPPRQEPPKEEDPQHVRSPSCRYGTSRLPLWIKLTTM